MSKTLLEQIIKNGEEKMRQLCEQEKSLSTQIKKLSDEKAELANLYIEETKKQKAKRLLYSIYSINKTNHCVIDFCNKSTTEIFTFFENSSYIFMIIKDSVHRVYITPQGNAHFSISLVLTKIQIPGRVAYASNNNENPPPTPTDLKQLKYILVGDKIMTHDHDRFLAIKKEIFEVPRKIIEAGGFIPFKNPCFFRAQNVGHRSGHGDIYEGEDLISSQKYGDTSGYAIIGMYTKKI